MANEELLQKLRRQSLSRAQNPGRNVVTLAGFRRLRMGEDPLPLPVGTRPLDQTKER